MQLLTVCMHLPWRILQQYTDDFNDAGFADITEERKAAFEDGNTTRLPEAQKAAE